MLCDKISEDLGKDAIYIGGSIQTLFGILSSRENNIEKLNIMNTGLQLFQKNINLKIINLLKMVVIGN